MRTLRLIADAISCASSDGEASDVGADDLVPALIYTIVVASPIDAIHAQVRYASLGMNSEGEEGYAAATFEGVLEHLIRLKPELEKV